MIGGTDALLVDVLASDLVDDPSRSAAAEPHRAEVTARRRRRWATQAILGATTLGSIGGFVAIARTIDGADGNTFDRTVVGFVGRARHPVSNAAARAVTFLGSVPGAVSVSLGSVALARRRPRLVAQIAIGAVGGVVAELLVKRFFRRERPTLLAHLEKVGSSSFPSGHSMAASSLYLTLAFVASRSRRLRRRRAGLLASAGAVASAIGATRVFLGVHWPTDVLGGLALGTAWACASEAVFDLTGADRVEREAGLGSTTVAERWTSASST
jgi:undecaprenyl-diphosphatase